MRILLVDDEAALLQLLGQYFTRQGHEAVLASTLAEASTHIGNAGFDAAVIDLTLPDGLGDDLARTLLAAHPNLKTIIATGYAYEAPPDLRDRVTVLQKPFLPRVLLNILA